MTNYYWIIAQHSGKVLEVEGGSVHNCAKIIQYTKKSEDDPSVDTQLWFFDGGFIINKISGLVIDVLDGNINNCAQIIQHKSFPEPVHNQEWDYNYEDNSIRLRSNRKFVLDVAKIRQEDATPLILYEDLCGPNQKFTLQKWNYTSGAENVDKLVTNIMDNYKFLPKLSQNLLEILNDDEYYDVTIEVGNDPNVKIFRAHMIILNCRSTYLREILSANKKKNGESLVHIKLPNILPEIFEIILRYIYEFLDRVLPYKKVLPKELYTELLREFLDNNTKTSSKSSPRIYEEVILKGINSNIITSQHAEEISKWIKRLEITDELTTSIEFKLLFRGSRDGFYPVKFHEICDSQSHTVTIAKVAGSNEILGGYNPIAWKSDNIYDKKHAIDNRCYCGLIFGNGDLIIWGFDHQTLRNYCRSSKSSYEKPIRETEDIFSIEEYEVFRVMFKI
ncbi:carbohydrate-binding module family 13 protein [Rhizophagus irregularis DAOM 181602=DAOM 197198]|nr:carbohydrate-binding module family 13 protein [Rhizophagus irregularis DAOM 181602=DAOM 197198]